MARGLATGFRAMLAGAAVMTGRSTAARPSLSITRTSQCLRSRSAKKSVMPARTAAMSGRLEAEAEENDAGTAPCRTTLGITALPTRIAIELKCLAVLPEGR